ncbi:MAG TPA: DUF4442 domain-containing protein [Pseudobdellovibrionaceae bacterium]|nr:DUF4442 domain-containing protein [Pseudobdellovibrionaceae bacterium]
MTTLLSKGLELEQSFKKNIENAQNQLKKELESRGLRLSAADLAALIEEFSPAASKAALSSALEFMKPFTSGLGLRVARLSDTQVEIVIPTRTRNLNESGQIHEAVLLAASAEACQLLWKRHAPLGTFRIETKSAKVEVLREVKEEARVRWELPETLREKVLSDLRQQREIEFEADVRIVDDQEQTLAEVSLQLRLKHVPALDSKES